MKRLIWCCLLLSVGVVYLTACVSEFDPKLNNEDQRLAIECQLTTKLEYQYVYLTYDAPYNASVTVFKNYVIDAKIKIVDDLGKQYVFFDDLKQSNYINSPKGFNYRSEKEFKAELGRTYQLYVETANKNTYVSNKEKVNQVPKIESVNADFKAIVPAAYLKGIYNVAINVKDKPKEPNFYKWDWYHVATLDFCREYTISAPTRLPTYLDPCCQTCYEIIPCVNCLELGNDKLIDGNTFNKQIAVVPYDNSTNYYMVINQYGISEAAYKYWNAVKEQSKNSGGLFDAIPKSLKGNFINAQDPSEEVLGYFTVADLHQEIVVIDRNRFSPKPYIVEKYLPPAYAITATCFPCEERYNRTKIKPKGWI